MKAKLFPVLIIFLLSLFAGCKKEKGFVIFVSPANPSVQTDVTFTLSPDNKDWIYYWNYGDGTSESSVSAVIHHQYANPGDYIVSVDVKKSNGKSEGETTVEVVVH
jgi:hypothetical protein